MNTFPWSSKRSIRKATSKDSNTGKVKTAENANAIGLGRGDEINHASMVAKMKEPEASYYKLFKDELKEKYPFKEDTLEKHFGEKYEQNQDEAITEAEKIGAIRGDKSETDGFEAALFHCNASGYTTDSTNKFIKKV